MKRSVWLGFAFLMGSCSGGDQLASSEAAVQGFKRICPGPDAQQQILTALYNAQPGDTIQLCLGTYNFTTGLVLNEKQGITIRGAGKNATTLDFSASTSAEGIAVSHTEGVTIEGLHVLDTPGNGIRIFRSSFVTVRDVAAGWSDSDVLTAGYQPASTNGAYALYPVESTQILMEDCYAYGSSDAGVYVGQSSDIVVRRCLARFNVAGYEFENTYRAVFEDNVATENTGGFLMFDLPDLKQFGESNVVRRNHAYNNNLANFAPAGNVVGLVPRGTGILVLGTDRSEIYDNIIENNDTFGIAIVNYGLINKNAPDRKYDYFPEGLDIHGNVLRNNATNPALPDLARGVDSALPLVLQLKNGGQSAQIMWDGGFDVPNTCTVPPTDADGIPLTQPRDPATEDRTEARLNILGRPNYQRTDNPPECGTAETPVAQRRYNAWKFVDGLPQGDTRLCIRGNTFEGSAPSFLNANFPTSAPEDIPFNLLVPASNDLTPHDCALLHRPADDLRVLQLPYGATPGTDPNSPGQVQAACNANPTPGDINRRALAYNCPRLDQYALFADGQNPTVSPRGGGVPFELNTALFSDYATKYRFLYLPPGAPARYQDHLDGLAATLAMPVGTVIAKTFAFRKENATGALISEQVVETRLLIKRETASGTEWVGLPYIWKTDASGNRYAELHVEGGTATVAYDYLDPDPAVKNAQGQRLRYTGSTNAYTIPPAMSCITCHGGEDREAGAAPLGLKARYLNRTSSKLGGANQLVYLRDHGQLEGLPTNLAAIEKHPRWNVPGDTGHPAGSKLDVQKRVRAYLEVNCAHCHSADGEGSNSGLFLDAFRAMDVRAGICKKPVAAGRGSGGRLYDIVPGQADNTLLDLTKGSILTHRVGSTESGVRMPPIARSVVHNEFLALARTWINALPVKATDVTAADQNQVTQNTDVCTGLVPGLLPKLP